MLESMRNHTQGWIAKVILGAIILSFALWGIGDYFSGNQVEAVAEIDGEAILDVDFAATYQRQLATYANMLGDQFTKELADKLGVKNETIQTMINRKLMLMEAQSMGLVTPDEAILATIQTTPQFTEKGKGFSPARYEGLIRQMGFASPRDYESYLRRNIVIDTLQQAIIGAVTVSDEEVKKRFKEKFEKRVLAALIVNPASLKDGIEVSDGEAHDWYDAHASLYQSPLKVEVALVEINGQDLMDDMSVTDADIEAAYEDRQADFGTPEKRKASHIMVRLARDASDDVVAVAQAKIEAAKARIDAGESFADVAKDVSDDVTASEGGNIGFVTKGTRAPGFEEALFSKLKVGEVSDVVRTPFGLHLIQLNAIQEAKVKPLAEVRDVLVKQLKQEAAANEAYRLSQDLDNALGMEGSLQAAAESVNLKVKVLDNVTTDNILANPLLASSKDLQKKVFGTMPGDAVEIVEVGNDHFVALEVLHRTLPETMPFEDVVKRVYNDVKEDLAVSKAQSLADDMLKAAQSGDSVDTIAQKFAQPKFISKPVLKSGEGDDSSWIQSVLEASFRTPKGSWVNQTLPTSKGVAVVLVQDVQQADDGLFANEADAVREEAVKAKGAVRFARWMASVRNRHDITVNNRVLNRF